jgi:hypothetical protein
MFFQLRIIKRNLEHSSLGEQVGRQGGERQGRIQGSYMLLINQFFSHVSQKTLEALRRTGGEV